MKTLQKSRSAFSLIEVTLAIAIVAFGFIAVFGLIPVGLNTFRNAKTVSVSNQIAQRLITEYEQADWTTLITGTDGVVATWNKPSIINTSYNEQGQMPPGGTTGILAELMMNARVRITPGVPLPGWASTDGTSKNFDPNVAKVVVQVAFNPTLSQDNLSVYSSSPTDPLYKLWTGAFTSGTANTNAVPVRTYTSYVARDKIQ
jgi:type II secretory pathway pseudopilin PulG